jgi:hypothetical protein
VKTEKTAETKEEAMLTLMILPNSTDDDIIVRVCYTGLQGDRPVVLNDIRDVVMYQEIERLVRGNALPALSEAEKKILNIIYKILRHSSAWSVYGPDWSTMYGHSIEIRIC